jgi:hypothetical protein
VNHAFARDSVTHTDFVHEVDGGLFENAGSGSGLDVRAVVTLENNGGNTLAVKQSGESQSGGSGTDDRNLSVHV